MSDEVTYTISEASSLTGLHKNTIRQRIRLGQLQASVEPGKFGEEYRIAHSTLEQAGLLLPPGQVAEGAVEPSAESEEGGEADRPQRASRRRKRSVSTGDGESLEKALGSLQELYQRHEQAMFRLGYLQGEMEKVKALAASAESLQEAQAQKEQELLEVRMTLRERELGEKSALTEAERSRQECERLRAELAAASEQLQEMETLRKDMHQLKAMATEQQRRLGALLEEERRPWWKFW